MTPQLEKVFFNYTLKNKKYFAVVKPFFFRNAEIQFIYRVVQDYMLKATESIIPTPRQILDMVALEDKEGIITKEILKSVLQTKLTEYSEKDFILPKFNTWILSNRLKTGSIDVVDEVRNLENVSNFEEAVQTANKMRLIIEEMSSVNFIDDDNMGLDFDDPEAHVQDSSKYKVKSGFQTIDHLLGGGWDISTLNIIMAETNVGKCVHRDTMIKIKNKGGEIKHLKISDFFKYVKNGK